MEEAVAKKNIFYKIGFVSGILAILTCLVTLGLSVVDSYFAIYLLFIALVLLGINRIGLHLSNFKKNVIVNITHTIIIFVLAVLISLTKFSIYFLISSMFSYSVILIIDCIFRLKEDRSTQSIIFNLLCIVFFFLYSFIFFFPEIYEKHATSVSNSNFIVLCFVALIIASSSKNIIFPYHRKLKLHIIGEIMRKSFVYEIILGLLILIILCSVYFTLVEPTMISYVDSLWYSFAVVTTIGFGDVSVSTTLGRILSTILGICGIVVIALFTSVIVNFYNEVSNKRVLKPKNNQAEKTEETKLVEDKIENKEEDK